MQSEECVDWPVWSRSNPYGVISALWGRLLCPPSYEDIICPRPAAINHCSLFINIQSMAPLTHTNTLPVCKQTSKQMQTWNHWLTPNTNTSNSHDHFSLSPSTPPFFFFYFVAFSVLLNSSVSLLSTTLTDLSKQRALVMSSHQSLHLIKWAQNKKRKKKKESSQPTSCHRRERAPKSTSDGNLAALKREMQHFTRTQLK